MMMILSLKAFETMVFVLCDCKLSHAMDITKLLSGGKFSAIIGAIQ